MEKIHNKLLADYDSNHIIMVYPAMHNRFFYFEDIKKIYLELSIILSQNNVHQSVIIPEIYDNEDSFFRDLSPNVEFIQYNCDDIWIRDYHPKLYSTRKGLKKIDFDFNGYGEKYMYINDNNYKHSLDMYDSDFDLKGYVIEGGNLEFSSKGVVITNKNSFIKNNHKYSGKNIIDKLMFLKKEIPFNELFVLELDSIKGDDTNGHVDNMVRFIDDENLVYLASTDKSYVNYDLAKELKNQLEYIKKKSKIIKDIYPIFHDDRDTLYNDNKYYPYSKLNFIITSNCIIFPSITNNNISIFDSLNDLPIRKIKYNINCEASLIECGGLHCLSMNI